MAGTKEGAAKARETRIKRFGGLEGYQEEMKRRQRLGGSAVRRKPTAFEVDPKLASDAGRKGAINRHHRKKVQS